MCIVLIGYYRKSVESKLDICVLRGFFVESFMVSKI